VPDPTTLEALRLRALPFPIDAAARALWQTRLNELPVTRLYDTRFDLSDPAIVRLALETIGEQHLGGLGTHAVNGAVIAGMFDAALGVAGTLHHAARRVGTVELSIKLMRPVFDAPLEVLSIAVKCTPHLAFTSAELYGAGKLCATASGIVAVASGPKGREPDAYW